MLFSFRNDVGLPFLTFVAFYVSLHQMLYVSSEINYKLMGNFSEISLEAAKDAP